MAELAISSNIFAQFSRQEMMVITKSLGFKNIDVWVSPVFVQHIDFNIEDPKTVKAEFEQAGMNPISLSIYFTTMEEKFAILGFAAAAGIPYITFEAPPLANFQEALSNLIVAPERFFTPPGAGWSAFLEQLRIVLDKASEVGVRVALQVPHVYTLIETSSDVKKLREDMKDHPALYFALSPTHMVARGSSLQDMIDVCGDRLVVQHIWNVKKGYTAERDDRSWGTPLEQLAIKGYFDYEKMVVEHDSNPVEYLCLKCHGTEGWKDREKILQTIKTAVGDTIYG
ncbi:MAG: sugar phosphate isomerase/epimerase [Bacteroidetes bacterium]|nr:sugar phosphate isomerase/epimerase [Bacteroidota bacterium]